MRMRGLQPAAVPQPVGTVVRGVDAASAHSGRDSMDPAHGPSACSTLAIAASSSATSRTGVASRARFLALRRARSFIFSAFWRSLLLGGRWALALTAWFRYALSRLRLRDCA